MRKKEKRKILNKIIKALSFNLVNKVDYKNIPMELIFDIEKLMLQYSYIQYQVLKTCIN